MNKESAPPEATPAPAPAPSGPTPGQMLRGAREARGVSLDELVSETRINRVTLEALEADRKPPQDAAVFVRGYFKRCAKVLGIDENALIQAYEARAGRPPAPQAVTIQWNSSPEYTVKRTGAPAWFWPAVIGGSIFACVLVAVALLKDDEPQRPRSEAAPRAPRVVELTPRTVPNEEPAEAAPAPAETSPEATPESEGVPLLLQPAPPAAGDAAPEPGAVAEAPPADQPVPGVPSGQYALFMEFSSACWTVVTDNDNDRLLYGMFKAGDRKEVIGEPPYRVSLGYAPGVKMYYEGKPLDFSGKVNPGDTTARFTVPF